jgi:hypothetical protein
LNRKEWWQQPINLQMRFYDFFYTLADDRKSFATCRDDSRALLGYKCVNYKKRYTVVFIETETSLIIVEFVSSKMIHW